MAYAVLKDAIRTTVASYTVGSGSITVATGTGNKFPTPSSSAPILITVITVDTYATYPETYATYQVTGQSGDTLTGLTVVSGNDMAWAVGAIVEMRTCAKHLNDLAAGIVAGGGGGSGSGTVGAGTPKQIAGYSAAGTAVAGMTTGLTLTQHTTGAVTPTGTSGTITLDLSTSDLFIPNQMTGNCTLALANPPVGGLTQTFRLLIEQAASGGPFSLAYPGGIVWVGSSTAPDMTLVSAGQTLELVFTYINSGLILGHVPGITNTDPPAGGSGTVNSGTTNQIGYYATSGTALSPLSLGTNLSITSGTLNAAGGGGSSTITETSETASFTAVAGGYYAVSGSAAVTATLPTAVGIAGQTVRIRCVSGYTGLCTITGTSGQTISGATIRVIFAGESPLLQSDGTNWVRTGGSLIPMAAKLQNAASGGISLTPSVYSVVPYDTPMNDNASLTNITAHTITIRRSGLYRMSYRIGIVWPSATASNLTRGEIGLNGTTTYGSQFASIASVIGTSSFTMTASTSAVLAAGAVLDVRFITDASGVSIMSDSVEDHTSFELVEIPSW